MELIDGNKIAQEILEELQLEVSAMGDLRPTVVFIRIGEDPASVSYVNKKQKTAASLGIVSRLEILPESTTKEELFALVDQLNADPAVHGILIQAPLPEHIPTIEAFNRVDASKDVDGFSERNLGKLLQEQAESFVACTPAGVCELLQRSGVETEGAHVVVLGRSLIVGKPAAMLMLRKGVPGNATVTVCHSRSKNLADITRQADILIAAMGVPEFVKADMVKDGVTVIDVGMNRVPDASRKRGYRLCGDVDFAEVSKKAAFITPVPGGVGPMTVTMLMRNTVRACKWANKA